MLRKNLTYTGITRAKKLVILVGTKRAVAISVSNNRVERRLTGLELFLKQVNHQPIPVKE
jgi:exodeoxyribonuclease V alpha subunit